jgi:hypothetical protein
MEIDVQPWPPGLGLLRPLPHLSARVRLCASRVTVTAAMIVAVPRQGFRKIYFPYMS